MNAFLTLHQGGTTILVNYFNTLAFTEVGGQTVVLHAADSFTTVDESIEQIEAMITAKAVWSR